MDYRCGIDVMREIIEHLFEEGDISKEYYDGHIAALNGFIELFRSDDEELEHKMKIINFPERDDRPLC